MHDLDVSHQDLSLCKPAFKAAGFMKTSAMMLSLRLLRLLTVRRLDCQAIFAGQNAAENLTLHTFNGAQLEYPQHSPAQQILFASNIQLAEAR